MSTLRWITLRLFWSLLALIPVSFFVLWAVHAYALPQSNVLDEILVVFLAVALFALASGVLTREGERRFNFLQERGRMLLDAGRESEVQEVFALLLESLRGGLLSEKKQQGLQRQLLRSYFPFYAEHPERRDFQEQLLTAMRAGVRPEEAFHVLKSYVLDQKALTLETTNLAEELLDYRPDDDTLAAFFVEQFLHEKKTHYRAEYFYTKYLIKGGPLTDEILALGLPKILPRPRRDDFAGWGLVRACERQAPDPRVRQALYALHQAFQKSRRRDTLAQHLAAYAAQIAPEERAAWRVAEKKAERKSAREILAQWRFQARQWWWEGLTLLRPYKREAALGVMVLSLVGVIYLTRSFYLSGSPHPVAPECYAQPETTRYFWGEGVAL